MRRAITRLVGRGLVLAAALFAYGCGGGGGSGDGAGGTGTDTGTLRVSLTDAPACGYESVNVTVTRVRVHQSAAAQDGQAGWSEIVVDPPRKLDLLSLSNGVLYELGQVALPAGSYQQIRLVLADNASVPLANTVVPTGGAESPLDTPSAQQSGIKLQANVDVPAGETVDVVLDFDACRSVVRRGNSGRHGLKPVIAVVPMVSAGSISGYAAAVAPIVPSGVKVSAQVGATVVKETVVASGAQFRLSPVPAGVYDVVFTAEGRATRVVSGVPVSTGVDTVMSSSGDPVSLPLSGMGTVDGQVLPADAQASVRALQSLGASSKIEAASANADGQTGHYLFMLPIEAVAVASPTWPSPPVLEASSYTFVPVPGSAATYQLEASASGFATSAPRTVTVDVAVPVSADFSLVPAP